MWLGHHLHIFARPVSIMALMLSVSLPVMAASDSAKVISTPVQKSINKAETRQKVVALLNMDEVLPDCQQQVTMAKVKTVLYSESGLTPEKFEVDWRGSKFDIATNVGENPVLSLEEIQAAHQFIKVGKRYLIHFQLCGDGSQHSLINMYAEQAPVRPARKIKT